MPGLPMESIPLSFWSPIRLAYGLLPVVTLLERCGHDAERLLEKARIDRFGLMDPRYTITVDQELAFLDVAIRTLNRPELSLELARSYRLNGFSVLGLAMQCSATPLQMLQLMMRFPRLAWGLFDGRLDLGRHDIHLSIQPQPRLGAVEGFLAERDFACALALIEEVTAEPFPLEEISFRHDCGSNVAVYEDFFHCPVRFGARQTALRCRRDAMERLLPHAEATMCAFYTAQCERMSRDMDQPFSYAEAVRTRLLGSPVVPDLGHLAAEMFLTPRTLQRRLKAEAAAFSDLLRQARQQRAHHLLADTRMSMEQIAATLGFGDAVAFSHAFKSWHGCSPLAWRQSAATSAPKRALVR